MSKKYFHILIFTIFQFSLSYSQELKNGKNNPTPNAIILVSPEDCNEVEVMFEKDIKNKSVYLFLHSGIAPVEYINDKEFQNKFSVTFFDFGCEAPQYECIIKYNHLAFDHLEKNYGEKWRNEIRDDVIGLNEWRRKK